MERWTTLLYLPLLFLGQLAWSDPGTPVSKISSAFVFDGKIEAAEWGNISPVELTVQTPIYHGEASERSEIKLGYDETYIYLSGALFDREVEKIKANNKERDGGDASTEWFGMVIDSYNDNQNALGFFTTPTGSRFDAAVLNDASGRSPLNTSWNNFWEVKTEITDDGWFVEMRVPFSSLPYQIVDGQVTMGITMWRYIARNNEVQISPDISPDLGEQAQWRPSLAKDYTFDNITQKKPFYITPYILLGGSRMNELNGAETAYERDDEFIKNVGLDVKFGLTNNFTLDVSVNTDFAQVEADDQQINLSRFSLFFPEKRLFFQERAGIFDFQFGSRQNLFYSRRIGIDEDGNTIPILGGARVTGRSGDWDLGLISMQTKSIDSLASNNYSVFRVRRRIINENSDAGFLLTNNIDVDGNYNTVYGFDTNIKVFGDNYLNVKFAQAISSDVQRELLSADPSLFWVSMARRSQRGFTYGASFSRLGKDFDSKSGFIAREDYTRLGSRLQYNWFPGKNSNVFRHGPQIRGVSFWDNTSDKYNSAFYNINYQINWRNGSSIELGTRLQYDDITESFDLADIVVIPVADYFYQSYAIEASSSSSLPYVLSGEFQTGDFYDGKKSTFRFSPSWNISSSLRLNGTYEFNHVNFELRNQNFDTHIARIKALLMFSTKFSISSFVQYNSLNKVYLGNIRLRYNPREGNDLFVVFNSDLNVDRAMENPLLPTSNQGSVLVKYSYTFSL